MMELLYLYQWTIVSGMIAAPALAILGTHLATRDRAMQTLCVGQGAMVGVLGGIGLLIAYEDSPLFTFGPFGSALLVSSLTYLVTDMLVARHAASKNTTFAFVFALLLAIGYLVGSLFPALESHMAQIYFGDLATLTETNSRITLVMSLLCLGFLLARAKSISNQSFELAIFGETISSGTGKVFQIVSLMMLCLSVQFVGFLFTIAMLFVPTAVLTFVPSRGLKRHFVLCALVSSVSTVIGFVLSLRYTRLPTVPAIVAVMFILSVAIILLERFRLAVNVRSSQRSLRPLLFEGGDTTH